VTVFALLLEDLLDVSLGLVELDVIQRHPRTSPFICESGASVIGGKGCDHVSIVEVEQVLQVEGSVTDVEFGIAQVLELEGRSAAQLLDLLRRLGRDLHQTPGVCMRGLVDETGLRIDDRGDQGRVDALLLGLLPDHVLVTERQADLLDALLEEIGEQDHGQDAESGEQEQDEEGALGADAAVLAPPRGGPSLSARIGHT